LVDANPLVALVDQSDGLHSTAMMDLARLQSKTLRLPIPCLTEAAHRLSRVDQRERLWAILLDYRIRPIDSEYEFLRWENAFGWMRKYADQRPDFADAYLCVLALELPNASVWSYDSQFETKWRRPDGSAVPMAVRW
jgi:predicted nucleic acid-binding protein